MKFKVRDLAFTFIFYLLAILSGMVLYLYLPFESPLLKVFLGLLLGTVILYIISLILKYQSLIGLMWGIFPIVGSIVFLFGVKNFSTYSIIMTVLMSVAGLRYLVIYITRFVSFRCEDFRIAYLKSKKHGQLLIALVYLLLPLILFTALLPGFYFVLNVTRSGYAPSVMTGFAFLLMLACIIFEAIADFQLTMFKKIPANQGLVFDRGLWKNSRHPNYFFEIVYWFSVFLVSFSMPKSLVALVFCPLGVFTIVEFFSIKILDQKELEAKPAYKEYMERTYPLIPFFPPKQKNNQ